MIRTSCSVKLRVVIFHINATKEEIETQVRPYLRDESATTCLWFTTVNRVIVVSVYGGGSRLYFSERRALVLLGDWTLSSVAGLRGAFCRRVGHQWTTFRVRSSPRWLRGQPL